MLVNQPEFTGFAARYMPFVNAVYPFCYYIGIQTMRFWRIVKTRAWRVIEPILRFFRALWKVLVLSRVDNLRAEKIRRHHQLEKEKAKNRALWEEDRARAILRWIAYPFRAVWIYRRLVNTGFNYVAPVAAICVMALTINQWAQATYALYVSYDGQEIGYVQDESVFEEGLALAQSRVAAIDNTLTLSADTADMAIATTQTSRLLDDHDVCNAILRAYGDEVSYMSGLYVNEVLVGALETEAEVQAVLDGVLKEARAKKAKKETISFLETVEIIPGLYPSVSLLTPKRMKQLLTDKSQTQEEYTVQKGDTLTSIARDHNLTRLQLIGYNRNLSEKTLKVGKKIIVRPAYAYLHIQSSRTEVKVSYIPYDTETVRDTSEPIGYKYVKVEGRYGEIETTYEVLSVDGEELSRKVISEVRTKEPVTQVNAVGAMSSGSGGSGVSTGKFIWPVPGWYMVTSGFGWRPGEFHKGIDIYQGGIYGANIVAIDGGRVSEVIYGWGGGYGNHVIVDHGNGYTSHYTHCSALLVSVGDRVSQGQVIAKVGSTGSTTGPGIHFEIRRNGQYIDPLPLLHR